MRRSLSLLSLLALAGCDTIERLQNEKVLAGVLLETPGANVAGTDVPGAVTAQVFFGEISGAMSGAADVQPISGATVQVSWTGGGSVTLAEAADGYYEATGGSLEYAAGTEYTFRVVYAGETYSGRVTAPAKSEMYEENPTPPPAYGTQIPEPPTLLVIDAAEITPSFPICRTTQDIAVVSVAEVTAGGVEPPTFVPGAPTDPGSLIALLFDQGAYTVLCFEVPESAFPQNVDTQGYLLGLTALRKGTGNALSSNLFLASGVFAGTTDVAAAVIPQ